MPESIDFIELSRAFGMVLREHNLSCATAESCTAGLVGHVITLIAGSSDYFQGGIIAYSNQAKTELLDVRESTLSAVGAVSRETAIEMARGARDTLHADIGISTTGIAGPGGATALKPVGLIYVAVSTELGDDVRELRLESDRVGNIERTAEAALRLAIEHITYTSVSDG